MGKLLGLFLLVIVEIKGLVWVLAIVEIASLVCDYRERASIAPNRASGAPPPMLDEPGGMPTDVAPSENGTNRVYVLDKSAPTGWQFRGRSLSR